MEIELRDNNLFITGQILDFGGDEQILIRELLKIQPKNEDRYHIVIEGDRLDKLAYQYYNNIVEDSSKYWWLIADANDVFNPLDLSDFVGKEILIPDLPRIRLQIYDVIG